MIGDATSGTTTHGTATFRDGFRARYGTVASDPEPVDRFTQLCDAVVDTRQGEDGPELRVHGGSFDPRSWTAF